MVGVISGCDKERSSIVPMASSDSDNVTLSGLVVTGIACTLAERLSSSCRCAHARRGADPATASNCERYGPLCCAVLRFATRWQ